MRVLQNDLNRMRQAQESSMFDLAQVGTPAATANDYNEPVTSYTWGGIVPCAYRPGNVGETLGDAYTTIQHDASARFPLAVAITSACRVRVVARSAAGPDPATHLFDVVGDPLAMDTVQLALLRRVTV